MRPVDITPVVEQRQDLDAFPLEESVDRVPTRRPVIQTPMMPSGLPSPDSSPVDLQGRTDPGEWPAGVQCVIDQIQQDGFVGPGDTSGDRTVDPQPYFPRSNANSMACSIIVRSSRSTSAWSATFSGSSRRPP